MKQSILYFFSFLLISAILAPSITILASADEGNKIVMDYSEEENQKENKEEKQELNEKDLLFFTWSDHYLAKSQNEDSFCYFYLESESLNTFDVILPPPKV